MRRTGTLDFIEIFSKINITLSSCVTHFLTWELCLVQGLELSDSWSRLRIKTLRN